MSAVGLPIRGARAAVAEAERVLGAVLDPLSVAALREIGIREGQRCLTVGGSASLAGWLARRVGRGGRVHALGIGELAEGRAGRGYDVIHLRCAVGAVDLADVAGRLVGGGTLLVEDFVPDGRALIAHRERDRQMIGRVQERIVAAVRACGHDVHGPREVPGVLAARGLRVATTMHAAAWRGGTPGTALLSAALRYLSQYPECRALSAGTRSHVAKLYRDPDVQIAGHVAWMTRAERPAVVTERALAEPRAHR